MKFSVDLAVSSPQEWIDAVLEDFDSFLQDHADCERKASGMAMSLVAKYPNRTEIIPELIETAVEEMEHFRDVYQVMESRGVQLRDKMEPDPYIKLLLKTMGDGIEQRFMDRLLVASIVECRGAERFRLIYEALPEGELKSFYHRLWASEAKHGNIFVKMALNYFPEKAVYDRLAYFVEKEGEIIPQLKIRPALH